MNLSDKQLKLLWAETGNLCAFPGCTQALVVGGTVVGEMAHIHGENPGSSRHKPTLDTQYVNSPANLIVLCPTHHTIIDKKELETKYPVDLLMKWKRDHAAQVGVAEFPEDLMERVLSTFRMSVQQVAINSPGAIQALGDVSINIHNRPTVKLVWVDGGHEGVFGSEATLVFAAEPAGATGSVLVELETEGAIGTFETAVVGNGMVQNVPSVSPTLDSDHRFRWGQQFLNVGNAMRIRLNARSDRLGKIRYWIR